MRTHVQRTAAGGIAALRKLHSIRRSVPTFVYQTLTACSLWVALITAMQLLSEFRPIWVVTYSRCLTLPHTLSLDFDAWTTSPTHLPVSTGCVLPNASSSNWRLWFTSRFTASHRSTLLMTCATLPTFQADDDYDQQALSSWTYPELGWLLSVTESSVVVEGCGTVYHAMSLSVRLVVFSLSFPGHCLFVSPTWSLRFLIRPC